LCSSSHGCFRSETDPGSAAGIPPPRTVLESTSDALQFREAALQFVSCRGAQVLLFFAPRATGAVPLSGRSGTFDATTPGMATVDALFGIVVAVRPRFCRMVARADCRPPRP